MYIEQGAVLLSNFGELKLKWQVLNNFNGIDQELYQN